MEAVEMLTPECINRNRTVPMVCFSLQSLLQFCSVRCNLQVSSGFPWSLLTSHCRQTAGVSESECCGYFSLSIRSDNHAFFIYIVSLYSVIERILSKVESSHNELYDPTTPSADFEIQCGGGWLNQLNKTNIHPLE